VKYKKNRFLSRLLLKICYFVFQSEWEKAMKDDEAVKVTYISPEIHAQFISSFIAGNPNYDILVK
jgi:hypothetical protein